MKDIRQLAEQYESFTGRTSKTAKILEVGFGARPHRAFALQAAFADVTAVDLDQPVLSLADAIAAFQTNGLERAFKGLVRFAVFDQRDWPHIHEELHNQIPDYEPSRTKLVVGDASSTEFWASNPGPYDLIFSSNVFEHIPRQDLDQLLRHISANLATDGICITRPTVFTGISGGHEPAWYAANILRDEKDRDPPIDPTTAWHHLRDAHFRVDTYLNKMNRRDFAETFAHAGLEIIEDRAVHGPLGSSFLSGTIRSELAEYDDYELFSNEVLFVLRHRVS